MARAKFEAEDAVCVAVLCVGWNGFLVLAEEGDFPRTGDIVLVGWMSSLSVHMLVAWFLWILLMKGSSILWGFSMLV